MIKVLTVIGARPQFIKAAVMNRLFRSDKWSKLFQEIVLHTGQHYDDNMSDIFFREMEISKPDINLGIGGGSHGYMTGTMIIKIEEVLFSEKPDLVIVYGDTNSTLAAALAASKLHIPVAHIEAGLRSFNMQMPEEQNRILTDHVSSYLFCPTLTSVNNLTNENVKKNVFLVGDIMYDAMLFYSNKVALEDSNSLIIKEIISSKRDKYGLATIHRQENTDDRNRLKNIVHAFNDSGKDIIIPLHPRTQKKMFEFGLQFASNVVVIEPVGYFDMIRLQMNSSFIITDSGGIQKEAYFLSKPCITLREETEWIETIETGWNVMVGADIGKILSSIEGIFVSKERQPIFGDGKSSEKMLKILITI